MKAYWISKNKIRLDYNEKLVKLALKSDEVLEVIDISKHDKDKGVIEFEVKNEWNNLKHQYLLFHNARKVEILINKLVKTDWFDKTFIYKGDDLGNNYSKTETTFKVWSPVARNLMIKIEGIAYNMDFDSKTGVWSTTIKGDLEGKSYVYLVNIYESYNTTSDPYAISAISNGKASVVIDNKKVRSNVSKCASAMPQYNHVTIYETSIRDFTIGKKDKFKNGGKFLGMIEQGVKSDKGNSIGFDHLINLGITHLQLMPIYDFGSVDEDNQEVFYNWGYDPVGYNVVEGSYASDPNKPYARINELKSVIEKMHKDGIRVTMDVVYNHVLDVNTSQFQALVPDYYFRFKDEEVSNGSFCGNDFESRSSMGSKYIVDSCKHWIDTFGIDGFRFDLMGIIDINTVNEIKKYAMKVNKDFMIYGEGWNMPSLLDDKDKCAIINQENISEVGFFNDRFRNFIKDFVAGKRTTNDDNYKKCDFDEIIMNVMKGSSQDIKGAPKYFNSSTKSLNYVECHDDETLFDWLKNEVKNDIEKRHAFATALVLIADGVSFLHCGQEFMITKNGVRNTYMSDDSFNAKDWDLMDKNIKYVEFIKHIISFKKELDYKKIEIKKIDNHIFEYIINNQKFIINGSDKDYDLKESKQALWKSDTLETSVTNIKTISSMSVVALFDN